MLFRYSFYFQMFFFWIASACVLEFCIIFLVLHYYVSHLQMFSMYYVQYLNVLIIILSSPTLPLRATWSDGRRGGESGGVRVCAGLSGDPVGRAIGDHVGSAVGALPRRAAQRVLPDGLRARARRLHAARPARAAAAPALARRPGGRLAARRRYLLTVLLSRRVRVRKAPVPKLKTPNWRTDHWTPAQSTLNHSRWYLCISLSFLPHYSIWGQCEAPGTTSTEQSHFRKSSWR